MKKEHKVIISTDDYQNYLDQELFIEKQKEEIEYYKELANINLSESIKKNTLEKENKSLNTHVVGLLEKHKFNTSQIGLIKRFKDCLREDSTYRNHLKKNIARKFVDVYDLNKEKNITISVNELGLKAADEFLTHFIDDRLYTF